MSDLTTIPGLGIKSKERLAHLGIFCVEDLLLHLPLRYQDKTHLQSIGDLVVGEEALVRLKIISTSTTPKQFICTLADEHNTQLTWRFFNALPYLSQNLVRGAQVEGFGEVRLGQQGLEMIHPEYALLSAGAKSLLHPTLLPVYPLTGGILQKNLAKWIQYALDIFNASHPPSRFAKAINFLHFPPADVDKKEITQFTHPLQQYLILEELASKKLLMLHARKEIKQQHSSALTYTHATKELTLDFHLTSAQQRVIAEIQHDLAQNSPMRRLLQGDVGSGKTIVAIISALIAVRNHKQVAIMAPTTILAKQHFATFHQYLQPLGITIALLTSGQASAQKTQTLKEISSTADIIIGTHALLTEEVVFRDLALVIIDEQHKFGVKQRLILNQKSSNTPHQLLMSATPIPRSIVMTYYGEMDVSIIDELPKNRQQITTLVLSTEKKNALFNKIKQVCDSEQQVYWVCSLIEDNENYNATSATQTFTELQQALPELRIALIHSKTESAEKKRIMSAFERGELDILVATTVIEVGVNVPNAAFMVVENAEKMGLATLHQLRGRVGRGSAKSVCVLLYQAPLSENARARLDILRNTGDGFKIAAKDLELRGAGEILGVAQSGGLQFKIANIVRDENLLPKANILAQKMFQRDIKEQQVLLERWTHSDYRNYLIS